MFMFFNKIERHNRSKNSWKFLVYFIFSAIGFDGSYARNTSAIKDYPAVYVDQNGILRSSTSKKEVAYFGVNYTVPFAFSYRAHNYLGISQEKAIEQDVYHLARIGVDAFRVHVWDIEITDSAGNLQKNEHLRLFDFLIAKLKVRNIKILLTPIAYWGNGYPEKDTLAYGFSKYYNKDQAYRNPKAIAAQENYIKQLLSHVNPYTNLSYTEDPDIIAMEICNEPSHWGDPKTTTDFINKMVAASREANWQKPIFYNTSQNAPEFADAILSANIDGCTFQWYPAGLVDGSEINGNFLPYVDSYKIPFAKNPLFLNKAKVIYEFDAADILKSYMYPAIARNFRKAGFQWATQFAYDPMALAYANTEYQTHYLNLAYTPSKAISLLIASKVFHNLPLGKNFGTFPDDSVFDVFQVSYKQSLSEMNSATEFYYSNSTFSVPIDAEKLEHIAGCGSSSIVKYNGLGAYFLDKLEDGIWRLEVMPDAIGIRDPFEKPSFEKEVTRIQWENQAIKIQLYNLSNNFSIKAINSGNNYASVANDNGFIIYPGAYLLIRKGKTNSKWNSESTFGNIHIGEFVAPKPFANSLFVVHKPVPEIIAGKPLTISATIAGIDSGSIVSVMINDMSWHKKEINFTKYTPYCFKSEVPAEYIKPGEFSYWIVVTKGKMAVTFPGNFSGKPTDWDFYHNEKYKINVSEEGAPLEIFNASKDKDKIDVSFYHWGKMPYSIATIPSGIPDKMALKVEAENIQSGEHTVAIRSFFGDKMAGRIAEILNFDEIVLKARAIKCDSARIKLLLIDKDANSYGTLITLSKEFKDYHIPLTSFFSDSMVLIPRPYPGFLPFWFKHESNDKFDLKNIEVLEVAIGPGIIPSEYSNPVGYELEYVWLNKRLK